MKMQAHYCSLRMIQCNVQFQEFYESKLSNNYLR